MTPLAVSNILADRVVVTSGGLVLVLILIVLFLFWPAPATGPRESPAGLLWAVLVILLILIVLGFL